MNPQAKVGLLVLIGVGILVYSTFQIEHIRIGKDKGYALRAYFDSVTGLSKKSYVKVAGVEAGRVEDIRLKPEGRAEVLMMINPDVVIHFGAEASLHATGLLGDKYINITPGPTDAPPLKDGDTLPSTAKSADIDELAGKLSVIADDVRAVTKTFKNVLGGKEGEASIRSIVDNVRIITEDAREIISANQTHVKQIMENVSRLTTNLDTLVMENRGIVNDSMQNILKITENLNSLIEQNRTSLDKTIVNLEEFTGTLRKDSPEIVSNAKTALINVNEILEQNRAILNKTMTQMEEATKKLNVALGDVGQITSQVKSGKGTVGKLVYNEDAYQNLDKGLKKINNLLGKMDELKTYIGVRSEYDMRAEDNKTYVSLKIQPREDKYYLLEVVDDPRGDRHTKTTLTETEDLSTGETIRDEEERETSVEDELKFSLQLAKRFYDLVIRGGIIESSGGLGLDYYLFDDDLRFSVEAWDFEQPKAHLKVTAQYFVQNNLFLELGGDDLANGEFRNFFVGAGFLFGDDDIKYLISNVPIPR